MNDLSGLLGGQGLQGILQQFQQGNHEAVPDDHVTQAYGQVASQLPQDQYREAAEQAFSRLSPEQRQQFLQELQSRAGQLPQAGTAVTTASADPGSLAQATAQVHAEQPNMLQQLFAPGGTFSNPVAKAALLGITAMAAQRMMGGRR